MITGSRKEGLLGLKTEAVLHKTEAQGAGSVLMALGGGQGWGSFSFWSPDTPF